MGILLFFIDGFGIGSEDDSINPLIRKDYPQISRLLQGSSVVPTDALLGIEGIPQSATGQTTLLTGVNGARIIGRHLSGFPSHSLNRVLLAHSILKVLKEMGLTVTNANLYTRDYPFPNFKKRYRGSATTLATIASSTPFRMLDDYRAGKAIYHDITSKTIVEKGFDIPIMEPEQASEVLSKIAGNHDFTLFEFFRTDMEGHKGLLGDYDSVLKDLDRFLTGLVKNLDFDKITLVIASDHGNIEDLSVKTHTKNMIPTIALGKNGKEILDMVNSLTDITPAIIKTLTGKDVFN